MKKYERIGIDANRDRFWTGVEKSYRNLGYFAVCLAVVSVIANTFF